MNTDLFKIAGQVAGIGGIALIILFVIYKEILSIFEKIKLGKDELYNLLKIIVIFAGIIPAIGIVAWAVVEYTKNKEIANKPTITPSIKFQNKDIEKITKSTSINLPHGKNTTPTKDTNKIVDKKIIIDELRSLGLIRKLVDAKNYSVMGGDANYEKSLELYRYIINKLSYNALVKIDQQLLLAAQQDEKTGDKELAARKYNLLFSEYIIDSQN